MACAEDPGTRPPLDRLKMFGFPEYSDKGMRNQKIIGAWVGFFAVAALAPLVLHRRSDFRRLASGELKVFLQILQGVRVDLEAWVTLRIERVAILDREWHAGHCGATREISVVGGE